MKSVKQNKTLETICRKYWNDFDPIGVVDSDIDDEYDSYLPQTIKLILECADEHKFYSHIMHCVRVNMGIDDAPDAAIRNFAEKLTNLSHGNRTKVEMVIHLPVSGCPVCGYPEIDILDEHGCTTFEICSSCGSEAGCDYTEHTSADHMNDLRRRWFEDEGGKWWGLGRDRPSNWDAAAQLKAAGLELPSRD